MIDYNKSQGQRLRAAIDPDAGNQPGVDDYRAWADRIHDYTTQLHRPDLARHGQELSDEAQQFVKLVQAIRADDSVPASPDSPPPGIQKYAVLTKQFHENLTALDTACPTS